MHYRQVGRSGLRVSALGLGTMTWGSRTDAGEARDILGAFLDAGGTLVDTAHGYGGGASEEVLGGLLRDLPREDVVITTKAGISRATGTRVVDTSRRALMAQLHTSLRRLGTDHVDLWLVHAWSDEVPLEETLSTLQAAVASGAARYVGVSNYTGWQFARAATLAESAGVSLVAHESEYSLVARGAEPEVIPAAHALGAGILAWSALGRGVLTGKYRRGTPADSRLASEEFGRFAGVHAGTHTAGVVDALVAAAAGLDASPAQVALAWLCARPGVASALIGPRTVAQARSVLAAADIEVPEPVATALDEVSAAL